MFRLPTPSRRKRQRWPRPRGTPRPSNGPPNPPATAGPTSISGIAREIAGDGATAVRDLRQVSDPTAPSVLPGTAATVGNPATVGTAGRQDTVSRGRATVRRTPHRLL